MENIVLQYPTWYLGLCFLLGLAFALGMYYRDGKFEDKPKLFKWLLGFLRTAATTIIAILLLSPLIKSITQNQKDPFIIMAEDASESIASSMSSEELTAYKAQLDVLENTLSEKFEVKRVHFGDAIDEGAVDSFNYKITNLSKAVKYISDNYGDQNVGAVFLATDGIFNEGSNPLYLNTDISAPFYPIALGDTTKQKDLVVKNVFHNKIVYLGDEFFIQADIAAQNCAGKNTRLQVKENVGGSLEKQHEELIAINGSNFFTTKEIKLKAKRAGIVKYQISTGAIAGEKNKGNNSKTIFVEVLDARQKILILANAPHPDLMAYRSILKLNKNYEVETKFAGRDQVNISEYDMVMFHDLPSSKNAIDGMLPIINRKRIPRIFVVGSQTSLSTFNQVQDVLKISGGNQTANEVQAVFKDGFSSFTLDENMKKGVMAFPPIIAPFGEFEEGPKTNTLLYQKIGKVDTRYPLMSFSDLNNVKTTVIAAEGIWKWRLFNYLEFQNHEVVSDFINKVVQYTSVKDDKRKFRADVTKTIFKENETIKIEAQLFNDSYEAINEPDVFLSIFDNAGKEYKYTFSKTDNYYYLEPGLFKEGSYRFTAKVNHSGKELTDKGQFSVKSIQLEQYDLTARHDVLHNLASSYGGKVFYPGEMSTMADSILADQSIKPIIYSNTKTQSVLNIRWLLGLLLFLFSLEWFLRRYHGSY